MNKYFELLKNNKIWSNSTKIKDKKFFTQSAKQQNPHFLWIGCSDSRVPANQICNAKPGTIFVHRNIANIIQNKDINCLSVVEYAITHLKIKNVLICGHYECGGIVASLQNQSFGRLDTWLENIKDVYLNNQKELNHIKNLQQKQNRLAELNVKQQVINISQTQSIQNAWKNKQPLSIHGLIYNLSTGLLKDLNCSLHG